METHNQHHTNDQKSNYMRLLLMVVLSFISMYILMYAMVDTFDNVLTNNNQLYMATLMTAPMVLIEMLVMRGMYRNRKLNMVIFAAGLALLFTGFAGIREQTGVKDRQFLRSMIPHHAAAVLMVKKAELKDPEVQQLARDIIEAQEKEIAFMKAKLEELDKK